MASDAELFQCALLNAIYWQTLCVELSEIIELFCLDAAAIDAARAEEVVTDG